VEAGFQRGAITTGGSKGAGHSSCGRAVARGETVPVRVVYCGSTSSGGTIGVRNGGNEGPGVGRWMRAGGRMRVHSSGPAGFGLGPGRKLCWVWRPSGTTSAGSRCSGTAAPTSGPKTEMRQDLGCPIPIWLPAGRPCRACRPSTAQLGRRLATILTWERFARLSPRGCYKCTAPNPSAPGLIQGLDPQNAPNTTAS
jgi:hypothetical protein